MTARPVQQADVPGRRAFLRAAGRGGLALGFAWSAPGALVAFDARAQQAPEGLGLNAWVHVNTEGLVTIFCPVAELGQGVLTALPYLVAEDMDADWSKVRVRPAPVGAPFGNPLLQGQQLVHDSRSVRGYWLPMRLAGVASRFVLLTSVAGHWNAPLAELTVATGVVSHKPSGRALAFGAIAAFAKVPDRMPPVRESALRPKIAWQLLSRDTPRIDGPAKVNGAARYAIDVELPGMVHAAILRPPVVTCPYPLHPVPPLARPTRIDDAKARAIEGVTTIVPIATGVAVIAADAWAAELGRRALVVQWQVDAKASAMDGERHLGELLDKVRDWNNRGTIRFPMGNADGAFDQRTDAIVADYLCEPVHHAAPEPFNAVAWVRSGECDVFAPVQAPEAARELAVRITRLPAARVRIHAPLVGGSFGHKSELVAIEEALVLSRTVGRPVKVTWSREDDIRHGAYRPAVAQRLEASVVSGQVNGWRHRIAADSIAARARRPAFDKDPAWDDIVTAGMLAPYQVRNRHTEFLRVENPMPVGTFIGGGAGCTVFAVESFVDEIAAKLGRDPFDFRMSMLTDPRARNVLQTVVKACGWPRAPQGRALGLAYSHGGALNAQIAVVADVSVDRASGTIRVHRLWCAVDPAVVIQPKQVLQQVETGMLIGLSVALRERITVRGGQVVQSGYGDYPVLRIDEVPEIDIRFVGGITDDPSGIGHIGVAPVAPAIANAVHRLTGTRLRTLPMLPGRVAQALGATPGSA